MARIRKWEGCQCSAPLSWESMFVHDSHKYVSCSEMTAIVIWRPPFVEHMKPEKKPRSAVNTGEIKKLHPLPSSRWVTHWQVARCLIRVETKSSGAGHLPPSSLLPSRSHLRKGKYSEGRLSAVAIKACRSIAMENVLWMQSPWINSRCAAKWNATCLCEPTAVAVRPHPGVSSSSSNSE